MANVVDASFYARRPLRVAFDIARSWLVISGSIALAVFYPHPLVIAAAVLVIGSQQYALQILLHDGLHRMLAGSKRATDVLCRVFLCYPLYTALGPFRKKHLDHHRWLGEPNDPDRYYHVSADKSTRFRFLLAMTGFGAALSSLAGGINARAKTASASLSSSAQQGEPRDPLWLDRLDWTLVLLVQVAIGFLLSELAGWWGYLFLWLVPFGLGVFVAQAIRSFADHAQPMPDELGDKRRLVTYRSNRLERIFLSPNNMNYHAEHHLYPQVPYYNLPRLREALRASGELAQAEERSSYAAFLWRYWRSLPIAPTPVAAAAPAASS